MKNIVTSCSPKVYKHTRLPKAEVSVLDTDTEENVPNSDLLSALQRQKIPLTKIQVRVFAPNSHRNTHTHKLKKSLGYLEVWALLSLPLLHQAQLEKWPVTTYLSLSCLVGFISCGSCLPSFYPEESSWQFSSSTHLPQFPWDPEAHSHSSSGIELSTQASKQ